ncbi:MAG: hypothetical protein K0R17_3601 [Rariglobus sp.]|jgi:uncharacterized protein YjbI with pentapeptide repeats|nr:hypothetical protein [Rariglobus sp.]
MAKSELKQRWESTAGVEFIKELMHEIPRGYEVNSSPFGLYGDHIDLRGLVLSPNVTMRRVQMKKVDLTGASFNKAWLEACYFEEVFFNDISAMGIADHGNRFVGCSFVGANLKEAALGYRGSKFQRTTFVEADFRRTVFIRPEFDWVTFSDCRLEGADFNASSFSQCAFSGNVKDVWFRGGFALPGDVDQFGSPRVNKMTGVSFERARLSGVTFSDGCDVSTITLPGDGSCIRLDRWRFRLEKLLEFAATRSREERKEIEIFCRSYLVHAPFQDEYIISTRDVYADYGEVVAPIILEGLKGVSPCKGI